MTALCGICNKNTLSGIGITFKEKRIWCCSTCFGQLPQEIKDIYIKDLPKKEMMK